MKGIIPSKKSTQAFTDLLDTKTSDNLATVFNEHFANAGQSQDDLFDLIPETNFNNSDVTMDGSLNFSFIPVYAFPVLKLLKKIPTGKAYKIQEYVDWIDSTTGYNPAAIIEH